MGEQGREEVRLSNYDITVRRTITTERFDHVTVAFNIVSERDHPTQIRLFEYIPPEVGIENIGFHPQFACFLIFQQRQGDFADAA